MLQQIFLGNGGINFFQKLRIGHSRILREFNARILRVTKFRTRSLAESRPNAKSTESQFAMPFYPQENPHTSLRLGRLTEPARASAKSPRRGPAAFPRYVHNHGR